MRPLEGAWPRRGWIAIKGEAELVINGIDPRLPLLGFYSGVEIAPFSGGYSRPLDWTGVLTIFQKSR